MGLAGKRILVVGASSGIGRALAHASVAAGAQVALCARRADRLQAAIDEAGGGTAVVADVRRAPDCERLVARAVAALGGLDALVYAAGITPLAWLADADAEHWQRVFETNVFGPAQVTRAALPHLRGGIAAYLSSNSVGRPRHGLVAYSASKAALDESILGWRTEHPDVRFLRVVVGQTGGTEAARDFDPDLAGGLFRHWTAHAFMTRDLMEASDLGRLLAETLGTCLAHPGIAVQDLRVEPPGPTLPSEENPVASASVDDGAPARDRGSRAAPRQRGES